MRVDIVYFFFMIIVSVSVISCLNVGRLANIICITIFALRNRQVYFAVGAISIISDVFQCLYFNISLLFSAPTILAMLIKIKII